MRRTTFFAAASTDDVRRSAPLGAPAAFTGLGGLASFPFSSLKHIARAAWAMARDEPVRRELEALIAAGNARELGRALDRLGAEGKLGERWSAQDFYHERSVRRVEQTREARGTRARRRGSRDPLVHRAEDLRDRTIARYRDPERLAPCLAATATVEHEAGDPLRRYGELLASLNEMIDLLPHVPAAGAETWRKLAGLVPLSAALVRELEAVLADRDEAALMMEPVLWRSLKAARRLTVSETR